jgi:hypothetical protein
MTNKLTKLLLLVVISMLTSVTYSQAPKDQPAPLTVMKTKVYKTIGLTRLKLYIFQPIGCKRAIDCPL